MLSFVADRAARLREAIFAFLSKPSNSVVNWERVTEGSSTAPSGEIPPIVSAWKSGRSLSTHSLSELLSLFHHASWLLRESAVSTDQWKGHVEVINSVVATLASCVPPPQPLIAAFHSSYHAVIDALNGKDGTTDVGHGLVYENWTVSVKHKHAWSFIR
jgi:hypothetical protein